MRLAQDQKLFFGFKIDTRLRDALSQASPGDRRYFEDPNSEFLKVIIQGEKEKWIGKIVDGGLAPAAVEDIQRNVVSILNRVAPAGRHSPSAMRIFCLDESAPPIQTASDDVDDDLDTVG